MSGRTAQKGSIFFKKKADLSQTNLGAYVEEGGWDKQSINLVQMNYQIG